MYGDNPLTSIPWVPIKPAAGMTFPVPAFGVVVNTGIELVSGQIVVNVAGAGSASAGSSPLYLVNGPSDIASASGRGPAAWALDRPAMVLYDKADGTPAVGETWGPVSGSYKLHKGESGFAIAGVYDENAGIAYAVRSSSKKFELFILTSELVPGGSATGRIANTPVNSTSYTIRARNTMFGLPGECVWAATEGTSSKAYTHGSMIHRATLNSYLAPGGSATASVIGLSNVNITVSLSAFADSIEAGTEITVARRWGAASGKWVILRDYE